MELCDYLVKAREQSDFTQKDLAKKLGMASAQLISNWERGICAPPIKKISTLCSVLGIQFEPTFDLVMKYKSEVARLKATEKPMRPRKGVLR